MEITVIETEAGHVAEYSRVEAGLADLRQRHEGVVFEVATTKGNAAARAARLELKSARTELERIRKATKAPMLEQINLLDTEAKRITAEILKLEEPIDRQIKADEERREVERAKREQEERERIARIRQSIEKISAIPALFAASTSIEVNAVRAGLQAMAIEEPEFNEFVSEASGAKMRAISALDALHAVAIERERQQAEVERQRQELEAQRAEQERLARIARAAEEAERKEREARQAEERAVIEAERKEREVRAAEERAAIEAERAELQRQRDEIAAQRAADAKAKADAEAQQEREAASCPPPVDIPATLLAKAAEQDDGPAGVEQPGLAADLPIGADILYAIAERFGLSLNEAYTAITSVNWFEVSVSLNLEG